MSSLALGLITVMSSTPWPLILLPAQTVFHGGRRSLLAAALAPPRRAPFAPPSTVRQAQQTISLSLMGIMFGAISSTSRSGSYGCQNFAEPTS